MRSSLLSRNWFAAGENKTKSSRPFFALCCLFFCVFLVASPLFSLPVRATFIVLDSLFPFCPVSNGSCGPEKLELLNRSLIHKVGFPPSVPISIFIYFVGRFGKFSESQPIQNWNECHKHFFWHQSPKSSGWIWTGSEDWERNIWWCLQGKNAEVVYQRLSLFIVYTNLQAKRLATNEWAAIKVIKLEPGLLVTLTSDIIIMLTWACCQCRGWFHHHSARNPDDERLPAHEYCGILRKLPATWQAMDLYGILWRRVSSRHIS